MKACPELARGSKRGYPSVRHLVNAQRNAASSTGCHRRVMGRGAPGWTLCVISTVASEVKRGRRSVHRAAYGLFPVYSWTSR